MELLKDPLIVVAGGELVARELVAREHQPAARGRAASAERIVRFACREQGLGRAVERSKRSSW